ncbi:MULTISPECIES: PhnD/SsuA/transferrin family substrate-binding protein [Helicobacter]|uniref:PhnD/SsuA/transferrin family substrate-binding protein n=1 Tax=Helicobacter colisuis TaxID=2949739 RepID=A0ABT0TSV7_9HELI|nr:MULTISPECIES: PhnD/SsuA/transferrin family substrate-binding protein [Helicobacter]MCI2235691.1 PhnD/SsuA/transferrin family substrate-binding protein [Helicobacter sp. CaF467b]MCL9818988.1 PhnD/SsuA/transferrin family substrate-binding protein [Helicobacter colisuis]MCL9822898.1 PhnD/SsuA/transferrin family substrate-binding protein [Helicobacter colisuis]RAX51747.1 phosphate ABC transporter substrate-binding protein [Helicobacter sp. 11-8110]
MKNILVGAVAYAPQIVPIWDTIRDYANNYFGGKIRLDYVLFSNYERQVEWLINKKIDIAWNTNVAYIRSKFATKDNVEAILMRDTDIGFKSIFVSQEKISNLHSLKGKKFGLGSLDSAQAAIMPLFYLQKEGLKIQESLAQNLSTLQTSNEAVSVIRYNSDVGKHGDTGRSEFDVLEAIKAGILDAGAIGSTTWARILQEGTYPEISSFYASEDYCHCNFTTLKGFDEDLKNTFVSMMLSQNTLKNDPQISQMMKLEGLNQWVVCDQQILSGYDHIIQAMQEQNLINL